MATLETFTELKELTENPHFHLQRQKNLRQLAKDMLDEPIISHINKFNKLPYCFTLQSCYGHFVYTGQNDPHNTDPLPVKNAISTVAYRIAYIAFCIEDCPPGRELFDTAKEITAIDPEYVQYGCADWFWKKQVNSYVLQVEPDRFRRKDAITIDIEEALHIEKIRNEFFNRIVELLENVKEKEN